MIFPLSPMDHKQTIAVQKQEMDARVLRKTNSEYKHQNPAIIL